MSNIKNLKAVKNLSDISLSGISVEVENIDNTLAKITLRDGDGNFVEFHKGSYEGVKAFVSAPPKMKDAYRVTAKLAGLNVCEDYESQYTAQSRERSLNDVSASDIKVEKVKVQDDAPTLEEVPF